MQTGKYEKLILEKLELVNGILAMAVEQNTAVKADDLKKAAALDPDKKRLIDKMTELDRVLPDFRGEEKENSENIKEIIRNVNSSLNNLIKIEKESETLISGHYGNISGEHINAYKTYKQFK
jgi:hypothetical protein